jgi:2-dehydropantoate 2-reductase
MRIAVIGAGGTGALLGASLQQAGLNVSFLARGTHLGAMKSHGLRIESERGNVHLQKINATDKADEIGVVDAILFCVKLWDVESAGEQIRPLVGSETCLIPMQNGIDASERLIPILGMDHVLGGVAMLTGSIVAPGVVRQSGTHHGIRFGELDGTISDRVKVVETTCKAAGIDAVASDSINKDRWRKFVGLAGAGICALTRSSIGPIRKDPDIEPLIDEVMQEVIAVGRVAGIDLDTEVAAFWRSFLADVPDSFTPSMAVDLAAGNRLELPWLTGKVVDLGRQLGVPTPVNRIVYAALKPFVHGAQKRLAG